MSPVRSVLHGVVALVVAAAVVAGVVVLVKNSDGAFSGNYPVVGLFAAAGQGLHPGSEVEYRGVQVGTVSSISLDAGRARVVLDLHPTFRFPRAGTATVRPQNLFGAEEVALTTPGGGRSGPWLASGQPLAHTAVADQIDDLFATADPLLQQIDTPDLAATVTELNQATNGQGPKIASGISEGSALGTLLSNTLSAQITALNSLTALSAALVPTGPQLNEVAKQANASLPAINNAQADFQKLLDTLNPLAENVAQFLSLYRPDIGALLSSGANVTRVLLVHESDIQSLIRGLYQYVTRLAGITGETLPDGSKFAYFQTFIQFGDVNSLVCSLIAPAAPGLAALAPLQQALASSGSPFNCASQDASFTAINPPTATPPAATPAAAPASAAPAAPASSSAASTGSAVAGQVYQALGAPSTSTGQSLNGYVQMLVGGL
jgi:phospholipid/cholesterol/gamma-HCH transport system substrate-binding protein